MGRKVLGGNEVDEVLLPVLLLSTPNCMSMYRKWRSDWREVAYLLNDLEDSGVGIFEVGREELKKCQKKPPIP